MDIPPKKGSAAPDKTVASILGQITWLMTQSPKHKNMFIADMEWLVMPALLFKQFKLFYHGDTPVALVLWALVSDEVDERLNQPNARMQVDDWRSGSKLRVVEMIAPFGAEKELLEQFKQELPQRDDSVAH